MLSDAKANKLATLKQHGQVTGQAKPKKPVITQRADGGIAEYQYGYLR